MHKLGHFDPAYFLSFPHDLISYIADSSKIFGRNKVNMIFEDVTKPQVGIRKGFSVIFL